MNQKDSVLNFRYVEVALPMHFDQTFTYRWSSEFFQEPIGSRVLVPFQRRLLTGYVLGQTDQDPQKEIKNVQDVLDETPILTPELIDLVHYIKNRYSVSLGEALQTVIPAGLIQQTKKKLTAVKKEGEPSNASEAMLLQEIRKKKKLDWNAWSKKNPELIPIARKLQKDGWITFETILQRQKASTKKKEAASENEIPTSSPLKLTDEQHQIVSDIESAIRQKKRSTVLLHGVTGSGKTEVYLQAAEKCLTLGRNVLALVPEISLTPLFLSRFQRRFGKKIALLHSQRSETERVIEWKRILSGEAKIVVGTRSSVFSPLQNIGLFIMDEEHDRSYKQDDHVMYHAKDIVWRRATHEQSVILLGSATPSIETFHSAQEKLIEKAVLPTRIQQREMPQVEIVDLQKEKGFGSETMFSMRLREEIASTLDQKKQVILFLNRRGYSTHVYCPSCGETLHCPHCSISMTYHKDQDAFQCHYCDASMQSNIPCAGCGSAKWIRFGFGTERVERELKFLFPDAVIDRLDRDTARKKNAFEKAFDDFERQKTDILIGTQMITKGLDFEHVNLVGVLFADQSLNFPDFRAAEQTFQLLTQVIGRSGRGKKRGHAVLQTLQPEHYAIAAAARQDYQEFYDKEIEYRRQTGYPPFSRVVLFEIKGKNRNSVQQMSAWLKKQTEEIKDPSLVVLGPSPAPIEKVNQNFRFHLFLKSSNGNELEQSTRWIYANSKEKFFERDLHIKYNIDPLDFM